MVDRRLRAGEVPRQQQREVLDLADAVLAGEGEDRVLLGVGRQDGRIVALQMDRVHVAGQGHADVAVLDVVDSAVPGDPHDPRLGLAVPVGPKHDPHVQLPR